jgi:hypothetical protein
MELVDFFWNVARTLEREGVIKLLGKYVIILVVMTVGLHFRSIEISSLFLSIYPQE